MNDGCGEYVQFDAALMLMLLIYMCICDVRDDACYSFASSV